MNLLLHYDHIRGANPSWKTAMATVLEGQKAGEIGFDFTLDPEFLFMTGWSAAAAMPCMVGDMAALVRARGTVRRFEEDRNAAPT